MQNFLTDHLNTFITKNSKVLDIGCGNKVYSNISNNTTTVDAWDKVNPDILLDLEVSALPFESNTFEFITMIDFIEHLDKNSGIKLIQQCKDIVTNKIIIYTPLVWDDNTHNTTNTKLWSYGNTYNVHKSLWTLEDFKDWETLEIVNKNTPHESWLGYWSKK